MYFQDLMFSFKLILSTVGTKLGLRRCEITGRNMETKEKANMNLKWDRYENSVLLKIRKKNPIFCVVVIGKF